MAPQSQDRRYGLRDEFLLKPPPGPPQIHGDIIEQEKGLLIDFDSGTRQSMTKLIRRLAAAAADRVEASGGSCCAKPITLQ